MSTLFTVGSRCPKNVLNCLQIAIPQTLPLVNCVIKTPIQLGSDHEPGTDSQLPGLENFHYESSDECSGTDSSIRTDYSMNHDFCGICQR